MRCLTLLILLDALCRAIQAQAGEVLGRDQVRVAIDDLERWIETSPDAGAWRDYLGIRALKQELMSEERPKLEPLKHTLRQSNAVASLSPQVARLRTALQGWLALECLPASDGLAGVAASLLAPPRTPPSTALTKFVSVVKPVTDRELRARLTALIASLQSYAERPSEHLAQAIDRQLRFLESAAEAQPLTAAVRAYYNHPNVWIDISEDLLKQSIEQTVERNEELRDVIQNTPLNGRGVLRGATTLLIEPRADCALLRMVFNGTLDAHTLGRNGPAVIRSHSLTRFRAEKHLVLDGGGLKAMPAACLAETRTLATNIEPVREGLGSRLIRRIGARRWETVQHAAEQESAQHAERQITAALDREADELIKRLDRIAVAPMLALAGGQAENARIRFCSTKRTLRIGAIYGPLGSPPGLPNCDEQRGFTVQVHAALFKGLSGRSSDNSLLDGSRLRSIARKWADRLLAPRFMPYGISLRNGEWGMLVPVSTGGDWLAVEWRTAVPEPRLAEADSSHLN